MDHWKKTGKLKMINGKDLTTSTNKQTESQGRVINGVAISKILTESTF